MSIELRPAQLSDLHILFEWRNCEFIVARSSLGKQVTLSEHKDWFKNSLAQQHSRRIWIIQLEQIPIGQIRFDRVESNQADISVYLLEAYTGKSYGITAIQTGCKLVFDSWDITGIWAFVRTDNPAGQKGFLKAGFTPDSERLLPNHVSFKLLRSSTCV